MNRKDLPGTPDIVLPKYNALIYVHGCFWHGHGCHLFKWPKTRPEFWRAKIEANKSRDARMLESARDQGWRVAVVWECAIKGKEQLDKIEQLFDLLAHWIRTEDPGFFSYGEADWPDSARYLERISAESVAAECPDEPYGP